MSYLDCLLACHQLGTVSSHQSDREVVILNEVKDLIGRPTKRKILRKKAQNDMTKAAKPPPTPPSPTPHRYAIRIFDLRPTEVLEGARIDYLAFLLACRNLGTVSSHQPDRNVVILNAVKDLIGLQTKRKILRKKAQNDMTKAAKPPPTPPSPYSASLRDTDLRPAPNRRAGGGKDRLPPRTTASNRGQFPNYNGYAHYIVRGSWQNQMGAGGGRQVV